MSPARRLQRRSVAHKPILMAMDVMDYFEVKSVNRRSARPRDYRMAELAWVSFLTLSAKDAKLLPMGRKKMLLAELVPPTCTFNRRGIKNANGIMGVRKVELVWGALSLPTTKETRRVTHLCPSYSSISSCSSVSSWVVALV